MRRATVLVAVSVLLGAACGGDGGEPLAVGDATPATGAPTSATAAPLAIPRCDELPEVDPVVVDGPLADDPEVAAWQQRRAEFGLPSDEAATRAADAERPAEQRSFGFPMTADEEASMTADNAANGEVAVEIQELLGGEVWFGGVWIDNARRAVGVAVTDDVTARQRGFDDRYGPGAVRVVGVERSTADLDALATRVGAALGELPLRSVGYGTDIKRNVVTVSLEVLDPAVVDHLAERVGTEGLCVEGADPSAVVPDGPQAQAGDGWRLLADEPGAGVPYDTGFAADDAGYEALWAEIGLDGPRPPVDFATEVVVWFGPAVSGSCSDIRLEDVVVDADAAIVHPLIVLPGGDRGCSSDANPHAYVVAVERTALPGDRFTITLGEQTPSSGCCPEATTEVDLRDE